MEHVIAVMNPGAIKSWRGPIAGSCAVLVGIGLARFAYTPLIPAMIEAQWFPAATVAYLGAASLAGYLTGALLGRSLAARAPVAMVLRAMMLLSAASLLACSAPLSFAWFFVWRFVSGVTGGVLMVLAAPAVLPHVDAARRGLAGGVIFAGVGLGIAASGTLVPLLLRLGLAETWWGLGGASLALTLFAWNGWPQVGAAAPPPLRQRPPRAGPALKAVYAQYALNAVGLVPHMVFLVDFIARGLGRGLEVGSRFWVLFGVFAAIGPMLTGSIADRFGYGLTLRVGFVIQAAAVALLAIPVGTIGLIVSSIIIGTFVPGIVPLVLGRVHEILPQDSRAQQAAWAYCTAAFALGQAAGAYVFSFIFAQGDGASALLFALGAGALVLALAIDVIATAVAARRREERR